MKEACKKCKDKRRSEEKFSLRERLLEIGLSDVQTFRANSDYSGLKEGAFMFNLCVQSARSYAGPTLGDFRGLFSKRFLHSQIYESH